MAFHVICLLHDTVGIQMRNLQGPPDTLARQAPRQMGLPFDHARQVNRRHLA